MENFQVAVVIFSVCLAIGAASNIGANCKADSECSSFGQYCKIFSGCNGAGQCACKSGYTSDGSTGCLLEKYIGDSCGSTSKCMVGSCTNSKCACPSGQKQSADRKNCVTSTYALVGDSCTSGQTCTESSGRLGNTNCVVTSGSTGTCQCTNGRKQSGQNCIYYDYGESCSTSGTPLKTCNNNLAYQCLNSKCTCTSGHTYYPPQKGCVYDTSTKYVKEGGSCNENSSSASKWCDAGLTCDSCPSTSATVCKKEISDSGSSAVVSFGVVTIVGVLTSLLL